MSGDGTLGALRTIRKARRSEQQLTLHIDTPAHEQLLQAASGATLRGHGAVPSGSVSVAGAASVDIGVPGTPGESPMFKLPSVSNQELEGILDRQTLMPDSDNGEAQHERVQSVPPHMADSDAAVGAESQRGALEHEHEHTQTHGSTH